MLLAFDRLKAKSDSGAPMSGDTTGKTSESKVEPGTDWERLRAMTDEEVHAAIVADPDARPTDEDFWKAAGVDMPLPKKTVTMCLDADLPAWLRRQPGYQTRINAILRAYINAHTD
jgi:uncharacterized protein (DUF4415 family)